MSLAQTNISEQKVSNQGVEHTTSDNFDGAKLQKPKEIGFRNLPVQCKLTVGAVDDPLEKEADAIADKIMRMPETSFIQRKCRACEEEDKIQRIPLANFIQRKSEQGGTVTSERVSNKILASKGKGNTLPKATKSFMESRFDTDFSKVNIHTGPEAAQLSSELNARAFTVGNDIYFNSDKFSPGTSKGKHLLAHELTHTIQQQGKSTSVSAKPFIQREEFTPWPGQIGRNVPGTRTTRGNIVSEQVQRIGDPTYAQLGPMLLELDTNACTLTIRKEINFVRAGAGANQLSENAFNTLKDRILRIARVKLNGWVSINMTSPAGCSLNCTNGIRVIVVTTEGNGSYASTLNLHPTFGRENAGNIGADASDRTIWHELGHIVLGAADEYPEANRPDGTPRPASRVNRNDWSIMSNEFNSRFDLMHARHFSHLPAWLKRRYPNCNFSLVETARPPVVEFTPSLMLGGFIDSSGLGGIHYSLGLDLGIPIDRLRRLEFTIGPRLNYLGVNNIHALLLGVRAGLEGQFAPQGFRLGGFAEGGGVGVNLTNGSINAIPYIEGGINANYSIGGRINFGAELATVGREIPALEGYIFYWGNIAPLGTHTQGDITVVKCISKTQSTSVSHI